MFAALLAVPMAGAHFAALQASAKELWSDRGVTRTADALIASVIAGNEANRYFPAYARERLAWFVAQTQMGILSVVLLKDPSQVKLGADDLMASGILDGRAVIVIAQPRFTEFLREGGRTAPPFGDQQRNDFMIGLVHEIVHLQHVWLASGSKDRDLAREESRTWREVTLNVVRPLRLMNQRVHKKFVRVDEALRSCGDLLPCAEFVAAVFR